eukprot:CAMPEP_0184298024 /NCGR_PEP_ID=MMETSP1049-20130417/8889_1 /TAXON_ID=77928 /ORGANISM="Proteomonas sulcata, Strain CCMP704" /LENGTH=85 /DNA_ID=CAMNT_0026608021 /DNA_START=33 /DNA_END=291 /DNA_ORIENTATION=-
MKAQSKRGQRVICLFVHAPKPRVLATYVKAMLGALESELRDGSSNSMLAEDSTSSTATRIALARGAATLPNFSAIAWRWEYQLDT